MHTAGDFTTMIMGRLDEIGVCVCVCVGTPAPSMRPARRAPPLLRLVDCSLVSHLRACAPLQSPSQWSFPGLSLTCMHAHRCDDGFDPGQAGGPRGPYQCQLDLPPGDWSQETVSRSRSGGEHQRKYSGRFMEMQYSSEAWP